MIYTPTIGDVNLFLDTHLNIESWIDATQEDQLRAIQSSVRAISRLSLETDIPDSVIIEAVAENSLVLLDGVDPNNEQDNLNVVTRNYSGARAQYDRNLALEHIRAGIMSSIAWDALKTYLIPNLGVTFIRVF